MPAAVLRRLAPRIEARLRAARIDDQPGKPQRVAALAAELAHARRRRWEIHHLGALYAGASAAMLRPMKTFTRNRRRKFIENYEYAPDFITKLQHELGDRATALRALDGLDAWFVACLYAENRMIGMPSKIVDVAWHEFILRTREYTNFCERAFGAYLHHTPDSTMNDLRRPASSPPRSRSSSAHSIPMVLFTADEDSGCEDGYAYSTADLHRMRDTYTRPPRPRKRRYATSSGSSGYAGGNGGCGGGFGGGGGGAAAAEAAAGVRWRWLRRRRLDKGPAPLVCSFRFRRDRRRGPGW